MPRTIALIVAAGGSTRFGGDTPKPYISLNGKSLLRHSLDAFHKHPGIDGVRVVIRREDHMRYKEAAKNITIYPCVVGGSSRQESVWLGLESIAHHSPERVLIHDAARPLVSADVISRTLRALDEGEKAVLPAIAVADTLKRAQGNFTDATVNRAGLFAAQTPQGFDFQTILELHRRFQGKEMTDDTALAEAAQIPVKLVEGGRLNFKITTAEDYMLAEKLAQSDVHETRVGFGVDVHPFIDHDPDRPSAKRAIHLCGINVPHEKRLHGHSDADAGLHAAVDAILGAIGAGDIGAHFPADDPEWSGANSSRFLLHAYQLLKEQGGKLVHLDVTILCERPHIAPYRDAMIAEMANILKLPRHRFSVKATTTEKLGYLGRGEGLAAHAVATVKLPLRHD